MISYRNIGYDMLQYAVTQMMIMVFAINLMNAYPWELHGPESVQAMIEAGGFEGLGDISSNLEQESELARGFVLRFYLLLFTFIIASALLSGVIRKRVYMIKKKWFVAKNCAWILGWVFAGYIAAKLSLILLLLMIPLYFHLSVQFRTKWVKKQSILIIPFLIGFGLFIGWSIMVFLVVPIVLVWISAIPGFIHNFISLLLAITAIASLFAVVDYNRNLYTKKIRSIK